MPQGRGPSDPPGLSPQALLSCALHEKSASVLLHRGDVLTETLEEATQPSRCIGDTEVELSSKVGQRLRTHGHNQDFVLGGVTSLDGEIIMSHV